MNQKIYDKFDKDFNLSSAYIAIKENKSDVIKFIVKYGKSGLSANVYLQVIGFPMVSTRMTGGNYNKALAGFQKCLTLLSKEALESLNLTKEDIQTSLRFSDFMNEQGYRVITVL